MTDSPANSSTKPMPPPLVVIAGWVLPGLGYWLIGQRNRAITIGSTILALFLLGILIGGIRVIDVPGFDKSGAEVRLDPQGRRVDTGRGAPAAYNAGSWALAGRGFFGEIAAKPWYVAQIFTGPACLLASRVSLSVARSGVDPSHARLFDIGTLYTAVAGMLNLMAIIDAAHRADGSDQSDVDSEANSTTDPIPPATA